MGTPAGSPDIHHRPDSHPALRPPLAAHVRPISRPGEEQGENLKIQKCSKKPPQEPSRARHGQVRNPNFFLSLKFLSLADGRSRKKEIYQAGQRKSCCPLLWWGGCCPTLTYLPDKGSRAREEPERPKTGGASPYLDGAGHSAITFIDR